MGKEEFTNSEEFQKFVEINKKINSRTSSSSHTFRVIEKIASTRPQENVVEAYTKLMRVGERHWGVDFLVELGREFFNKVFFFELRKLSALRGLKLQYRGILEAFAKFKGVGAGGTEVDLAHVPFSMEDWRNTAFILSPGSYASAELRREIIQYGLEHVQVPKVVA